MVKEFKELKNITAEYKGLKIRFDEDLDLRVCECIDLLWNSIFSFIGLDICYLQESKAVLNIYFNDVSNFRIGDYVPLFTACEYYDLNTDTLDLPFKNGRTGDIWNVHLHFPLPQKVVNSPNIYDANNYLTISGILKNVINKGVEKNDLIEELRIEGLFDIKNVSRMVSKRDRYEVCKRQKWCCNTCGVKLKYHTNSPYGEKLANIDHIHPFAKRHEYINGPEKINELSNLQALCAECNNKKGVKFG